MAFPWRPRAAAGRHLGAAPPQAARANGARGARPGLALSVLARGASGGGTKGVSGGPTRLAAQISPDVGKQAKPDDPHAHASPRSGLARGIANDGPSAVS